MAQRLRKDRRKRKAARRGQRRLRTIVGTLIRELERKLPATVRETHQGQSAGWGGQQLQGATADAHLEDSRLSPAQDLTVHVETPAVPAGPATALPRQELESRNLPVAQFRHLDVPAARDPPHQRQQVRSGKLRYR